MAMRLTARSMAARVFAPGWRSHSLFGKGSGASSRRFFSTKEQQKKHPRHLPPWREGIWAEMKEWKPEWKPGQFFWLFIKRDFERSNFGWISGKGVIRFGFCIAAFTLTKIIRGGGTGELIHNTLFEVGTEDLIFFGSELIRYKDKMKKLALPTLKEDDFINKSHLLELNKSLSERVDELKVKLEKFDELEKKIHRLEDNYETFKKSNSKWIWSRWVEYLFWSGSRDEKEED